MHRRSKPQSKGAITAGINVVTVSALIVISEHQGFACPAISLRRDLLPGSEKPPRASTRSNGQLRLYNIAPRSGETTGGISSTAAGEHHEIDTDQK